MDVTLWNGTVLQIPVFLSTLILFKINFPLVKAILMSNVHFPASDFMHAKLARKTVFL